MPDFSQPLIDHLEELRRRLIATLLFLAVSFLASFFFVDAIVAHLSPMAGGFVFVRPTEVFLVRLKIAFAIGAFLSVPMVIYQIWRFVGIALTASERNSTLSFLPLSYALFCGGVSLAWFVVLPVAIKFLLSFSTPDLRPMISIDHFVTFVGWFLAAFGLMFQLPLVVLFSVKLGLASIASLRHYRPHVYVGLALLSALFTPGPDVFSLLALLLPACLLYEASLLCARLLK